MPSDVLLTLSILPDATDIEQIRWSAHDVPVSHLLRQAVAMDSSGNRLDQKPGLSGRQQKVWFFTVRN